MQKHLRIDQVCVYPKPDSLYFISVGPLPFFFFKQIIEPIHIYTVICIGYKSSHSWTLHTTFEQAIIMCDMSTLCRFSESDCNLTVRLHKKAWNIHLK